MLNIFQSVCELIHSKHFFFITLIFVLCAKCFLFIQLINRTKHSTTQRLSILLLLGVIIGSIAGDVSWFIKLLRDLWITTIPYTVNIFGLRIAWAFLIIQYQSLALFIETVPQRIFRLKRMHFVSLAVSCAIACFFVYIAFFEPTLLTQVERHLAFNETNPQLIPWEVLVMRYVSLYLIPIFMLSSLFYTFKAISSRRLPTLLKRHMSILVQYFLTPFFIAESIVAIHMNVKSLNIYSSGILSISNILLTCSLYYSIRTILNLRFLNLDAHIPARQRVNFIEHFKEALETLSKVGNIEELVQITQTFFKEAFDIHNKKVTLHIKNLSPESTSATPDKVNPLEQSIEQFLLTLTEKESECLKKLKILINDELSFTEFYNPSPIRHKFIQFLQDNQLDIFLPIYRNNTIIAHISVGLNARLQHNYTLADHDEMLVYSTYLASVINLVRNRNLKQLIQKKHILQDDAFLKHQEINLYKESIEAFIKTNATKHIGICFYKNNKITIAHILSHGIINQQIIQQDRHPLTKAIKEIGDQVEQFKTPATQLINYDGIRIVLTAVSNLERQNVIVTLYQPEISDVLKHKINVLKDPERWNFLLYLETTKLGAKINQLIPSDSELMLNLKIELLQNAINRKIVLLNAPEEDIQSLAQVMCQSSAQNMLHILSLKYQAQDATYYKKMFGDHSVFGSHSEPALLEKANNNATILIENIHFLDLQTQAMLAHYNKTGAYSPYHSSALTESHVRIICTTNQSISNLLLENKCDYALYEILKDSSMSFPSLLTLPHEELEGLAHGYLHQLLQQDEFKITIPPTNKEISNIVRTKPTSLTELKRKVKNLLTAQKESLPDSDFEHAHSTASQEHEIIHATRLGKKALQDPDIMRVLWQKFKNQNKIATFLGVNRSSVNRRCKEYQLQ